MPKVRNVAKHLSIEVAKDSRMCHTNGNHTILPGEKHLAQNAKGARENICLVCAGDVLRVAEEHIHKLRADLGL